jgi:hypothetical protein
LENIAERQIEKDPIGFIREESFLKPDQNASNKVGLDEVLEFENEEDDEEEEKFQEL